MIPKVQGYAAFQPYREVPYPTLKVGLKDDLHRDVWSNKSRPQDALPLSSNFNQTQTVYRKDYLENTTTGDYEANMRTKPQLPRPNGHKDQTAPQLPCGHCEDQYLTSL
jgi:hypothetical protein